MSPRDFRYTVMPDWMRGASRAKRGRRLRLGFQVGAPVAPEVTEGRTAARGMGRRDTGTTGRPGSGRDGMSLLAEPVGTATGTSRIGDRRCSIAFAQRVPMRQTPGRVRPPAWGVTADDELRAGRGGGRNRDRRWCGARWAGMGQHGPQEASGGSRHPRERTHGPPFRVP